MTRDAFDDWMRDEGMSEAQVEAARADDAPSERHRCIVCGLVLDPYKGEAFVGKDGETYCNDHYPDPDVRQARDA